jgi:hypothetical protein
MSATLAVLMNCDTAKRDDRLGWWVQIRLLEDMIWRNIGTSEGMCKTYLGCGKSVAFGTRINPAIPTLVYVMKLKNLTNPSEMRVFCHVS